MTNKHVVYLEKYGAWYWTERRGNRVEYNGPFNTEANAKEAMEKEQFCDNRA